METKTYLSEKSSEELASLTNQLNTQLNDLKNKRLELNKMRREADKDFDEKTAKLKQIINEIKRREDFEEAKNIIIPKKIEIKSDYHVIRSYMYENDLVVWLFRIVKNASLNCPIYNVGSDQEINIRNLAFYLSNKYKLPLKIKKIKSSFEDRYLPSILKAKKELNLKLQYSNFRAINEVIKRLKNN